MSSNFKDNMKSNIIPKNEILVSNTNIIDNENLSEDEKNKDPKFKLAKKVDDKSQKKSFPIYMEAALKKDLDEICKKTNYSRNELINIMVKYCIENIELLK